MSPLLALLEQESETGRFCRREIYSVSMSNVLVMLHTVAYK